MVNRDDLQRQASEWTRIAKDDIRHKVLQYMEDERLTSREFAYRLGLSEGEVQQIINGNGEISITTFAKILIASGFAVEIKPIEETPLGNYDNVPEEGMFRRPIPRPDYDFNDDEDDEDYDEEDEEYDEEHRNCVRHHCQHHHHHHMHEPHRRNVSPFENKTREELVKIIERHLWDSEINVEDALKEELVEFLNDKNKRIQEYRKINELEQDPKVMEFKEKMKETFKNNPHLRDWARKIIGNVE